MHKKLERADILLGELKADRVSVFSDEKLLTFEATVNNQTNRVNTKSSADIDDNE